MGNSYYPESSMDRQLIEFDTASTGQGGTGASLKCVPYWQNRFYGILWNQFLAHLRFKKGFKSGSVFRIVLDGCDFTLPPTNQDVKRAVGDNPALKASGNCKLASELDAVMR